MSSLPVIMGWIFQWHEAAGPFDTQISPETPPDVTYKLKVTAAIPAADESGANVSGDVTAATSGKRRRCR